MKKTLYKLDFSYNATLTNAEMKKVQKYFPKFKFKEKSDFGIASYHKKDDKYKDWTEEDFEIIQADEYDEYLQQERKDFDSYEGKNDYIDLEAFLAEDLDVKFEIVGRKTITFTQPELELGITEYVNLFKTLERLSVQLDNKDTFSSHCDVHVGGNPLFRVNDLMLCEDYCTDALQEKLNAGWRILACCVQAQRRPDYILGKYTKDLDLDQQARRG